MKLLMPNKVFKNCLAISMVLSFHSSFSQISVRVFNYRPTGELGFVMKPLISAEIGYTQSFEESNSGRLRASFSGTFLKMTPRQSIFPISGVLTSGNGTTVLPGEESFQKYNMVQLFGGIDFAFMKKKKFYLYAGSDIIVGAASIEYRSSVKTVIDESYSGGGYLGGFRFRLGTEYCINDHIGIFFNANRSFYLVSEPAGIFSANDYGLGIRYEF